MKSRIAAIYGPRKTEIGQNRIQPITQFSTPRIGALAGIGAGDAVAVVDPLGDGIEHVVVDDAAVTTTIEGDWLIGVVALDGPLGETPPGSPVVDDTGAVVGVTAATASDAPAALVPIDIATDVPEDDD